MSQSACKRITTAPNTNDEKKRRKKVKLCPEERHDLEGGFTGDRYSAEGGQEHVQY